MTLSAILILMLLITAAASAAPAYECYRTYTQPSGETFTATLKGDEWFNFTMTDTGAVVELEQDGYWYYAVPGGEKGLSAGNSKYLIDEKPKNAVTQDDLRTIRRNQLDGTLKNPPFTSMSAPGSGIDIPDAVGTRPVLVLLVSFSDQAIQYSESQWSTAFFGTAVNTVYTYYKEVSANQFLLHSASESYGTIDDGVIGVTLPYAHPNTSGTIDIRNRLIVKDALISADAYVNFASFDTNNDGAVSSSELHVETDKWIWVNPLPQGNSLLDVIYAENKYITVGGTGTVMTSTDGTNWNVQYTGDPALLFSIAYGNGVYVAVGNDLTVR